MEKVFLLIASGLLAANTAYASNHVGQCVPPKTKIIPNGNLSFMRVINISDKPFPNGAIQPLTSMSSYRIDAEENGFVRLISTPDYSLPAPQTGAGEIAG